MMVVGLGASIVTVSNPTPSQGAAEQKTFQLSCREFPVRVPASPASAGAGAKIEVAINDELAKRGWTSDVAKTGLIIVMGGFSGSESPGDGDRRAKALLPSLRKASPLLEKVEMRTAGAQSVRVDGQTVQVGGAGSFVMVTYLLFSGPVLEEDCSA